MRLIGRVEKKQPPLHEEDNTKKDNKWVEMVACHLEVVAIPKEEEDPTEPTVLASEVAEPEFPQDYVVVDR